MDSPAFTPSTVRMLNIRPARDWDPLPYSARNIDSRRSCLEAHASRGESDYIRSSLGRVVEPDMTSVIDTLSTRNHH
jgi:hypothetical protein